jgi:hypothetical protein
VIHMSSLTALMRCEDSSGGLKRGGARTKLWVGRVAWHSSTPRPMPVCHSGFVTPHMPVPPARESTTEYTENALSR